MLKINTNEFIKRIIRKGFKQFHLDDSFTFLILENKELPTVVKTAIKDSNTAPAFFEDGASKDSKYIFLKLKDGIKINPDEAKLKFINFIKTIVLVDKNNSNIIGPNIAVFYIKKDALTEDKNSGIALPAETDKTTDDESKTKDNAIPKDDSTDNSEEDNTNTVDSNKTLFVGVSLKFN